ncbi:hypothetical protein M758_2G001200 [Ceratodon purpureus]|uniref:Uncharacterized protein n=1 Tax=Ceratodon purpureus TaxID=3225 RepID=A0A8T0I556_CERPU|nr:hypothetical protein KC19_5G174400 [Ceratodon purpureus]KAG0585292.1 hypothetical protein KC19_2G001600 [Ceratodon purpureus]KAG0624753.1 hypothetical protein M758_2G001200 [Ceratodon purpureus]
MAHEVVGQAASHLLLCLTTRPKKPESHLDQNPRTQKADHLHPCYPCLLCRLHTILLKSQAFSWTCLGLSLFYATASLK